MNDVMMDSAILTTLALLLVGERVVFWALGGYRKIRAAPSEPREPLTLVLHQNSEFNLRLLAQNSKLVEQLIAVCDPKVYAEYRRAATVGVPPGSIQPLPLHAPPAPRHDEAGSAVERAVERVVRDVARESGLPIQARNPSDVDNGSGLP